MDKLDELRGGMKDAMQQGVPDVDEFRKAFKQIEDSFRAAFGAMGAGFQKQQQEADEYRKTVQGIAKAFGAQQKAAHQTHKDQNKSSAQHLKNMKEVQKMMSKTYKDEQKQTKQRIKDYQQLDKQRSRLMRDQQKAMKLINRGKAASGGGGILPTGLSLNHVIGAATIYGVLEKLKSISTPFLNAEVNARGSTALIRQMQGMIRSQVAPSKSANLLAEFQNQSAANMLDLSKNPSVVKGLLRLEKEFAKGVGVETGNRLTLEMTKSFGSSTDKLRQFLDEVASSNDLTTTLMKFKSGQNAVELTRGINALGIAGDADKGNLDPLLQSNLDLTKINEKLDATLEKVLTDLATAAIPALNRLTEVISGMNPDSIRNAAIGVGAAALLGRPALGLAARGIGAGIGAVGLGTSALGAVTLGSVALAGKQSYDALHGTPGTHKDFAGWSETVDKMPGYYFKDAGLRFGAGAGYQPPIQLSKERQARIDARRAAANAVPTSNPITHAMEAFKSAPQVIADNIKKLADEVKSTTAKIHSDMVDRQVAGLAQSQLRAERAGSETDLARGQFQFASMSALGPMGAIHELKDLNATIEKEMERLRGVLDNIDTSSDEGVIAANKVKAQIMGLRTEERQNLMDLQRSIVDGYVGQAFGMSGSFEKLLVTGTRAPAKGLETGMIPAGMPGLGDLDPKKGLMPILPQDLFKDNPMEAVQRKFKALGNNMVQRQQVGEGDAAGHLDAMANHAAKAAAAIRSGESDQKTSVPGSRVNAL